MQSEDKDIDRKRKCKDECIAYGIDRYAWNQGYDAKYDFQIFENEEPCLVSRGGAAVCCPRSLVDLPK